MSDTYRRSSDFNKYNYEIDPDNVYFWRMNEKRLEAEQIRDSLLFVSGKLENYHKNISDFQVDIKSPSKDLRNYIANMKARSIYIPSLRDNKIEILDVFDRPDNSLINAERSVTTVSTQALFLMNNDKIIELAKSQAKLFVDDEDKIDNIFLKFLGRSPSFMEIKKSEQFIKTDDDIQVSLAKFIQVLICTGEFRNVK